MPPFDIDIYSLLPIMKYERDRQYCLYEEQKIMSRLGQSFRRVSHSTNCFKCYSTTSYASILPLHAVFVNSRITAKQEKMAKN